MTYSIWPLFFNWVDYSDKINSIASDSIIKLIKSEGHIYTNNCNLKYSKYTFIKIMSSENS